MNTAVLCFVIEREKEKVCFGCIIYSELDRLW